jgi:kynureninase
MTSAQDPSTTIKKPVYENGKSFAQQMDKDDPLRSYAGQFHFPRRDNGDPYLYFAGNSLGLQPVKTKPYIDHEIDDWAKFGVEGHLEAKHPWLAYHEMLNASTARLVGAKPDEVVVMNSLTVNLHLMMVSFYRPTAKRYKILIESGAFPSDQYAVQSQAKFHGFDPREAIVELKARAGEHTLRHEDILQTIEEQGDEIALVLLGDVNYLNGQSFDLKAIARAAHDKGCVFGVDLAHGAGNLEFSLHDWDVDFAVWCSYKYLNAGPGGIAGCFVHERHAHSFDLPRLAGWWGHNKQTRFAMGSLFDPLPGAEGWQLSNPPIFQLASLRASMELFDQVGMSHLRQKSVKLTGYLEFLLKGMAGVQIITPAEPDKRGCQLSLKVEAGAANLLSLLKSRGVICDLRQPDILRLAPVPMYNSFSQVYEASLVLRDLLVAN